MRVLSRLFQLGVVVRGKKDGRTWPGAQKRPHERCVGMRRQAKALLISPSQMHSEHALARLRVQDVADNGGGKVLRKEDCRETVE